MAQIEIKIPQLSESITEAILLHWHKKVGEVVLRDENLIDIETDKVVLELPAPADGIITHIIKYDGATVTSGEIIAKLDTDISLNLDSNQADQPLEVELSEQKFVSSDKTDVEISKIAMPSAKKLLMDNNIPISQINGTGKKGRVIKDDVLTSLKTRKLSLEKSSDDTTPQLDNNCISFNQQIRQEERIPMSRLRLRVAERLLQSQATNAILTTFNEVNMHAIICLRNKYKQKFEVEYGIKLGFMSFFLKAAIAALRKYPILNASVDGNDIVYHHYFDIAVAVSSPRGLVVPILRNADQMSIANLEKKINEFSQSAKDGKLSIEDLIGGTFTISNGGTFGSMLSTPIINPPQSAILGIHATKDRAVVENNQIVIRPISYFALSYDHRIIDGREAVLSLVAIKEALEDPTRLLLEI